MKTDSLLVLAVNCYGKSLPTKSKCRLHSVKSSALSKVFQLK
jgi:hypothetical protein